MIGNERKGRDKDWDGRENRSEEEEEGGGQKRREENRKIDQKKKEIDQRSII